MQSLATPPPLPSCLRLLHCLLYSPNYASSLLHESDCVEFCGSPQYSILASESMDVWTLPLPARTSPPGGRCARGYSNTAVIPRRPSGRSESKFPDPSSVSRLTGLWVRVYAVHVQAGNAGTRSASSSRYMHRALRRIYTLLLALHHPRTSGRQSEHCYLRARCNVQATSAVGSQKGLRRVQGDLGLHDQRVY
ncbi:hypothetical protein OH77DRAFT_69138 [Trametes cingulata]|nr:hypothetical protein OH77DRAFT_69138 [Trametes cingulata]